MAAIPWSTYPVLLKPRVVRARLQQFREAGFETPNEWQLSLGVLRMVHRMIFRSETIGMGTMQPARTTWRAKLLSYRPIRFPFLLAERAVAPLDLSGLLSNRERLISHLLAAHHDRNQFAYDLVLLSLWPGALEDLAQQAQQAAAVDSPRSRWLKDLVVYEGYHERLHRAAEAAARGDFSLSPEERDNPDISFVAYLRWCKEQPASLTETLSAWRVGRFSLENGVS